MTQLGLDILSDEPQAPKRRRPTAIIAVLVALLLVAGVLFAGFVMVRSALSGIDVSGPEDYPGPGRGKVVVEVKSGQSLTEIGRTLEQRGVVASVGAFTEAATTVEGAESVQPGFYTLKQEMRAEDAVGALLDPAARMLKRVTVPEGLRLDEILPLVAKRSGIPLKDYEAAVARPQALGLPAYSKGRVEGFLFPATYEIPPNATARSVLKQMVNRFKSAADGVGLADAPRAPYDTVVIASIIEGEARNAEDFPKVAQVIYNRLAEPMRLEMDSTVNYALKADKELVTYADLGVDSPYNTYENDGLPPGPINSPGERALAAAINPAQGDWLYFVTVNPQTGETKFASSYDDFLRLKAELKRNQRNG